MMLITERDQAEARDCVIYAIAREPDEWNGVEVGALPKLVGTVASAVTSERHRVLRKIEAEYDATDKLSPMPAWLSEAIRELKRPPA